MIWLPDQNYIVLGASNDPENSLFAENVIGENIPVYKRPSGGQSVMITPGTIVISVLLNGSEERPKEVFNKINSWIMISLAALGIDGLSMKGISDIAIGEKKILGSSMFRKKEKIFYHAVLNVSEDPEHLERFLKHPLKEPDYRKNRRHRDFVTSVHDSGNAVSRQELIDSLKKVFTSMLPVAAADHA
jgi:lipoate---protein ligase